MIDGRWKYYIVMCVIVQKKYVALMLHRAYRAAGLCVNMLKDNIDVTSKKWRF